MHLKGIIVYVFCIFAIFGYLIIRYVIFANKNIKPNYKGIIIRSAVLTLIVGFIIGRTVLWLSPRILVIEPDKSHHFEYAIFDFNSGLRIRSTYLKNNTNTDLYLNKHVYTRYSSVGHDNPKTIVCPIRETIKIEKVPDYFFEAAPWSIKIPSSNDQAIRWQISD